MTITQLREKVGLTEHNTGTVKVSDLLKVTGHALCPYLYDKNGNAFLFTISKEEFKKEMERKDITYVEVDIKSFGKLIFIHF